VCELGVFYSIDVHAELPDRVVICPEAFLGMRENIIVFCPVYGGRGEVTRPDFVKDAG
jgi:hypothetical protein